jgi:hypothetical protein
VSVHVMLVPAGTEIPISTAELVGMQIRHGQCASSHTTIALNARSVEDLEARKVYQILPDREAAREGYVRVVDESGEDYVYPSDLFVPVRLRPLCADCEAPFGPGQRPPAGRFGEPGRVRRRSSQQPSMTLRVRPPLRPRPYGSAITDRRTRRPAINHAQICK